MTIAEQNPAVRTPAEVPLYTLADAMRYLRVPHRHFAVKHFRKYGFDYLYPVLIPPFFLGYDDDLADEKFRHRSKSRLSFRSLAQLSVRIATLPVIEDFAGVMPAWVVLPELSDRLNYILPVVPFDDAPLPERVDAAIAAVKWPLSDDQRALLRKLLTVSLDRIEVEGGDPVRLFPLTRDSWQDAPRVVAIDPRVRFGRPAVRATPTDVLFERFEAGDSIQELAGDYGLSSDEIEEAVRFESRGPYPDFHAWLGVL